MKQCSICSKPAVYHVTVLKEGLVKELHYCEQHFTEYMNKPQLAETEESFIDSLLPESDEETDLAEADQERCPICGISYREFREKGRFGCPHDYIVFQERVLPLLSNIHHSTLHLGKHPHKPPLDSAKQLRLIELRKEMTKLIEAENYEEAAVIRDQIQEIEARL